MFYKKRYLAQVQLNQDLSRQIEALSKQLDTLKTQMPRLTQLSDLLTDIDALGSGLLHLQRIPQSEVYRWRNE